VNPHTDPRKALTVLQNDPGAIDLVISDYNMPGISGLEVAREVRRMKPNIPVIVTSGFIDEALRAQAEDAGVSELLFKADSIDVLCTTVARVAQTIGRNNP
jgi:CheY-like chemotaxis protein